MQEHRANNTTPRRAWLIYAVLALPYLIVYFHRVSPAVVARPLAAEFQLSGAQLGNLAAMYFYVYMLMQLPAGVLADAWGARRSVACSMLIAAAGALLFATAQALPGAYAGRLLIGLGVSVVFIPILRIITHWFPPHLHGRMSGVTVMIGNAGGLLASAPLAAIVGDVGWRRTFLGIAVLTLAAAALTWLVVRDRPPAHAAAGSPTTPAEPPPPTLGEALRGLGHVMLAWRSWPPFVLHVGVYGTLMAFQGVWGVPLLMQHYGMSPAAAAAALIPIGLGIMLGAPLGGTLADRLGRPLVPFLVLAGLYLACWCALALWPGGRVPAAYIAPLFFCFGLGASCYSLLWTFARQSNAPRFAGSAMGLVNMGGFLGGALAQPLFGWVLDRSDATLAADGARLYSLEAFHTALLWMLGFLALSLLAVAGLRAAPARG